MRLTLSLCTIATAILVAGCSGGNVATAPAAPGGPMGAASHLVNGRFIPLWSKSGSLIPAELRPSGRSLSAHGHASPMGSTGGIYVSEFYGSDVFGYPHNNQANNPPSCSINVGLVEPQGIGADNSANLVVPEGAPVLSRQVIVYSGPSLCGAELGSFLDTWGQPDDASSANAASGSIAVANMFDVGGAGSISVCTIAGGCPTNLTNSNMYEVASVLMDAAGDCWASAADQTGAATLTWFSGCTGNGEAATGYMNKYFGGLDIDKNGHIVSISAFDGQLYVYSGCKPDCTLVGGPFALQGQSLFGHLNRQSMIYAAADFQNGQIDVYHYSASGVTYWYSFNNGLTAGNLVEGVAVAPRSRK